MKCPKGKQIITRNPKEVSDEIGNYYGTLKVKVVQGIPYWGIENYNGIAWEQISPYLYQCIVAHKKGKTHETETDGVTPA